MLNNLPIRQIENSIFFRLCIKFSAFGKIQVFFIRIETKIHFIRFFVNEI